MSVLIRYYLILHIITIQKFSLSIPTALVLPAKSRRFIRRHLQSRLQRWQQARHRIHRHHLTTVHSPRQFLYPIRRE